MKHSPASPFATCDFTTVPVRLHCSQIKSYQVVSSQFTDKYPNMLSLFKITALSLCTVSASALHIDKRISTLEQEIVSRLLADAVPESCKTTFLGDAAGSLSSGLNATLFGYLEVNVDMPKICPDLSSCDISNTDFANDFRQGCVDGGNKVFDGYRISICQDTIGDLKELLPLLPLDLDMTTIDEIEGIFDSLEEIEITGIPVCLDSTCPADIDIMAELSSALDLLAALIGFGTTADGVDSDTFDKVIEIAERLLEGKECSSSPSNVKWSALAGALALGAVFFTL